MAPLWLSCSTAVLLLSAFVAPVFTQSQCEGSPGIPGVPGTNGADGKDALKGDLGEPGETARAPMGQKGHQGMRGPQGRAGQKGDKGLAGANGPTGQQGVRGQPLNLVQSFFSYKREGLTSQQVDTPLIFNRDILHSDAEIQGDMLKNGSFISEVKGIYYFSYHVSARAKVCLKLMKDEDSQVTLCDSSDSFLVTTGSAVMELDVGNKVSLQLKRTLNHPLVTQIGASHTFTGFLLFPMA
ncbi:complement C1q subcomponent subunit B [Genypterus blacodes]|uniref:complement C1q subcomponent subunit B n=1 Tax=Genypterus blacodes TaxID=154954 RepID=UPI003F774DB2